jgi:hypothetical protein
MHPEGGSWTDVRTHTPSKFSKVLTEPLAPIPLDRSKFRENGSQPPPNRTGYFRIIRLSSSLGAVGIGSLHLAYPYPRLPGKPAALRPEDYYPPVDGFPVLRLLRQLRDPRALTP